MTDFADAIMDLTFEHETPTWALLQDCLKALPDQQREVWGFFEAWVWGDWCEANAPEHIPTPEEEAETARWAEEATKRFMAALEKQRNSRVLH